MENFETNFIDLGEAVPKTVVKATFHYIGESIDDIVKIKHSCGCTSSKINKENNSVEVTYKTESVPKHLKELGYFTPTKNVKATFADGHTEVLTFKVRVYG